VITAYDVAIIGAGSVGAPLAWELGTRGWRVGVFDPLPSAGRGDNRSAIGGIRATHSSPAKARLGSEAIDIFSGWQAHTGDDIEWRRGGYLFVAYRPEDEANLEGVVATQQGMGLGVEWIGPAPVARLVPGIETDGLRGGAFSAGDGSASPLRAVSSFRSWAERAGVTFHFGESVTGIPVSRGRVTGVITATGRYRADVVINAAGAAAEGVGRMAGVDVPVSPESHEAGVTEPVERFLEPMVVDMRPGPGSQNLYLYQSGTGQVMFAMTPDPPQPGDDRRSTSSFLPLVSQRMVALLPRLRHLLVRRVWRGLYPMTPDGSPLLGWFGPEGFFVAAGMCGQGFMLGPGIAKLVGRVLDGAPDAGDLEVLASLDPGRAFRSHELLV
jgi:sarcosine oxidase, subunit beta